MKRLKIQANVCAGCYTCVLMCSAYHYGACAPFLSNIEVPGDEATASFTPHVCVNCPEHSCVAACPTGALQYNENTGGIEIDRDACVLCVLCVQSCEHHGIRLRRDLDGNECIGACDKCGGDPQCAKYCRQGALEWVDEG